VTHLTSPCTPQSRDLAVSVPDGFVLTSGERLSGVVRARLVGPEAGPLVVVAGGISADRQAADTSDGPGWWGWAIGAGAAIDTSRVRVLGFDWLPTTGENRIVTITTGDQARLLALVLDDIGPARVNAFIGASYGGCVGLAFAERFPSRLGRLIVISAAHRAHPTATAWRGVQRRLLQLGADTGREAEAIALARELAMTTYRSSEEFDDRFSDGPAPERAGEAYPVCDYLIAQGRAYQGRTTAARWISLSDSLDRHAVAPEQVHARTTVVGFTSDRLVPIQDSRALAERLPRLERLIERPSRYGHDAFLKERGVIAQVLTDALKSLPAACSPEIAA